ncbi:hypothetical protein [Spiroplasma floricola]|uniref:hypothetical protein n=1 Tax=Spiroplasma floricola TaxID=216937 RepID=UPI000C2D1095|nr:hypothetical protein [Spiroplasma floricola]
MDQSFSTTNMPLSDANITNPKEDSNEYIPDDKVYKLVKEKNKLKFSWIVLIYGWKYKALFLSVVFVVTFSAFLVSLNTLFLSLYFKQQDKTKYMVLLDTDEWL